MRSTTIRASASRFLTAGESVIGRSWADTSDLELTGNKDVIPVLVEAADSLVDRYDPEVGCIRSWDGMYKVGKPNIYRRDNMNEHMLVIIDNMMNLDLMYQATELTGDKKYADIASTQAEKMMHAHIRPDGTTYHVVDFRANPPKGMTQQGGYGVSECITDHRL